MRRIFLTPRSAHRSPDSAILSPNQFPFVRFDLIPLLVPMDSMELDSDEYEYEYHESETEVSARAPLFSY